VQNCSRENFEGKEINMNSDIFEGKWKQLKGHIRENWGELTDDEVDQIQGKMDILVGLLQEKYGYAREDAEREVNDFLAGVRV
jgi:uncharacterized protein YjbJ (UPF0337 family)